MVHASGFATVMCMANENGTPWVHHCLCGAIGPVQAGGANAFTTCPRTWCVFVSFGIRNQLGSKHVETIDALLRSWRFFDFVWLPRVFEWSETPMMLG